MPTPETSADLIRCVYDLAMLAARDRSQQGEDPAAVLSVALDAAGALWRIDRIDAGDFDLTGLDLTESGPPAIAMMPKTGGD